jgi:hypothetical protein
VCVCVVCACVRACVRVQRVPHHVELVPTPVWDSLLSQGQGPVIFVPLSRVGSADWTSGLLVVNDAITAATAAPQG